MRKSTRESRMYEELTSRMHDALNEYRTRLASSPKCFVVSPEDYKVLRVGGPSASSDSKPAVDTVWGVPLTVFGEDFFLARGEFGVVLGEKHWSLGAGETCKVLGNTQYLLFSRTGASVPPTLPLKGGTVDELMWQLFKAGSGRASTTIGLPKCCTSEAGISAQVFGYRIVEMPAGDISTTLCLFEHEEQP